MMKSSDSKIAVIGDENLVNGFKLAGVDYCFIIDAADNAAVGDAVNKNLKSLIEDNTVSIIVILEDYARHARELLTQIRESKRISPVIIELPSISQFDPEQVKKYYKELAGKFIGRELYI
jgi:vacuolar-type H+-ATPase subunit F/Vma7